VRNMQFNPGFRLSIVDSMVLLIGIFSSVLVYNSLALASFFILFVLGHFFLFCNVIRMSRLPELIWASSFLLLSLSAALYNKPDWPIVALVSLTISSILIVLEIKKPSYHGVFWQKINPELKQWFENKQGL